MAVSAQVAACAGRSGRSPWTVGRRQQRRQQRHCGDADHAWWTVCSVAVRATAKVHGHLYLRFVMKVHLEKWAVQARPHIDIRGWVMLPDRTSIVARSVPGGDGDHAALSRSYATSDQTRAISAGLDVLLRGTSAIHFDTLY